VTDRGLAQISLNRRPSWKNDNTTISDPTAVISSRAEIRCTAQPPTGAASRPPITSGTSCCNGEAPSSTKKVVADATVTKNSAVLTEPTVWRGACPEPTRVEVSTGPQPPPPLASRKPAAKPAGGIQPAGRSRIGAIRTERHRM